MDSEVKNHPPQERYCSQFLETHKSPILEHYLEKGTKVTSERYSEMLSNELKSAIRIKCRGLLSKHISLLHDVCPHTAIHTVQTLQKQGWNILHIVQTLLHLLATGQHMQEVVHSWLMNT